MNRKILIGLLGVVVLCVWLACKISTEPNETTYRPFSAAATYTGRGYGPFGLMSGYTAWDFGPAPFTASLQSDDPTGVVKRINFARQNNHRLVLFISSAKHAYYITNGHFDFTKWKNAVNQFNTGTIRTAIAAAVADGTVIGGNMMDEPEHSSWGRVPSGCSGLTSTCQAYVTKAMVDQMADYMHAIFPTLKVGVNQGPPAYKSYDPNHTFKKLDWVAHQYNWVVTRGDIVSWKTAVLARAKLEGYAPAFSINILDGGVRDNDNDGKWECPSPTTEGQGTYYPNCRMTATQIKTYGQTLANGGCFQLMWREDTEAMKRSDNQAAFKAVADVMRTLPIIPCKRTL